MTILSSLKKLHKKMTGQETDSKTIGGVLDSMQENYAGGSSGGDTYETVAEINIGEMTLKDGFYQWADPDTGYPTPIAPADGVFYLNDASDQSSSVEVDTEADQAIIAFNTDLTDEQHPVPEDPNKPMLLFMFNQTDLGVYSDTADYANTTVRILKKVSGGGSGDTTNNTLVVTLREENGTFTSDIEPADIVTTFQNKTPVFLYNNTAGTMLQVQAAAQDGSNIMIDAFACGVSDNMIANMNITYADGEWHEYTDTLTIPKAPLVVHGTANFNNGTAAITDNISISDIITSFTSGRTVKFEASLDTDQTMRLDMWQVLENAITFTVADISTDGITIYEVEFDNDISGTTGTAEMKSATPNT